MLLQLLRIKNLALVEDLEWQIAPGFTAITGETGAGKSIIIGALQLLLGERADKSLLRTGAETCTVEAIFQGDDCAKWKRRLEESGIEPCDGDLILKRSLSLSGTNRQFINGSPTTLAQDGEIVATRDYAGFKEPWLIWDQASCSFKPITAAARRR